MKTNEFKLKTTDNFEIHVYEWLPESEVKAVLQIAHGMAEHASRYKYLAEFLTTKGYAIYANDHRGHGKTAGSIENLGFLAENDGYNLVMEDMHFLTNEIKKRNQKKSVFLMGHSMGSFFSRYYITKYAKDIKGVILSGTAGDPGLLGKIGGFINNTVILFNGKKKQSPLMTKLSFGEFNKPFKPNRTEFDWLSTDNKQVDKYINDPYCGTVFTNGFFKDLLEVVKIVNSKENINKINKDLSVFFLSGGKDPVGDNGKGVTEIYDKFRDARIKDVAIKLYENKRHEILNETNKEEVYQDIFNFMNNLMK